MFIRRITSLTALLSFIALFISSIFTYLTPRGPGSGNWEALGLSKHDWFSMHTNLGLLFVVSMIVHIFLNYQPIIAYLKNKFEKFKVFNVNFNIALALTLWVIISSVFNWPPFSGLRSYKENLGNRGRHHTEEVVEIENNQELPGKPPLFYSRKSIERICREYEDLDAVKIIKGFEKIGITAKSDWTFKEIGKENDMDTRSVYDSLLQVK